MWLAIKLGALVSDAVSTELRGLAKANGTLKGNNSVVFNFPSFRNEDHTFK